MPSIVIPDVPVQQENPEIPAIPAIKSNSTNTDNLLAAQTPVQEDLEAANPVSAQISSARSSQEQIATLPPLPPQLEQHEATIELPFPEVPPICKDEEEVVLVIHEERAVKHQEKDSPRTSQQEHQEHEVTQNLDSAKEEVVKRDRIWSDAATGTSSITSPAELMQQLASITKMPLPSPVAISTKQVPLSLLVNQPPEVYKPPHRIFD